MNPGRKGSWPLRLGSIQPLTWLHDVSGKVARILTRGCLRDRAPCGTLQPFAPCPCAFRRAVTVVALEKLWLLDLGCSAPSLSASSWLRPLEGLWCPVLQSAWN